MVLLLVHSPPNVYRTAKCEVLCPMTDLQKDYNYSTSDPSTTSMCLSFQTVMKLLEMAVSTLLERCHEQRLAASPLAGAWCGASCRP